MLSLNSDQYQSFARMLSSLRSRRAPTPPQCDLTITLELDAVGLLGSNRQNATDKHWQPPHDPFETPCLAFLPYLDEIKTEARAAEEEVIGLVEVNVPVLVKVRVHFGPHVEPSVNEEYGPLIFPRLSARGILSS